MTAEELEEFLQGNSGAEVVVCDPRTGKYLAVDHVGMPYGRKIVLHLKAA